MKTSVPRVFNPVTGVKYQIAVGMTIGQMSNSNQQAILHPVTIFVLSQTTGRTRRVKVALRVRSCLAVSYGVMYKVTGEISTGRYGKDRRGKRVPILRPYTGTFHFPHRDQGSIIVSSD
jgi:hypothetical protein